jgi:hypothetical protein
VPTLPSTVNCHSHSATTFTHHQLCAGASFPPWTLLPIPSLMQLVYDKERRLRMMMKMHGLGDAAYWTVTAAWFAALYIAYMTVFVGFGSAVGLNMFTRNSYGASSWQAGGRQTRMRRGGVAAQHTRLHANQTPSFCCAPHHAPPLLHMFLLIRHPGTVLCLVWRLPHLHVVPAELFLL